MNIAELRSVSRSRQAGANKVVIGQAKRLGPRRASQPFDDMCLARPVQPSHNNPWSRHEDLQSECDANVGGGAARPTRTQAQISVDLAKVTCKQYLFDNLISANAPMVAVWLSGYFNGKRNNTVIDIGTFKKNKDVVEDYCRMNQDVTLIDAATKALGLDK
jgi:hypothetical protein